MTRSRGNKEMTGKPPVHPNPFLGLFNQEYQTNTLGLVGGSCIDPRLLTLDNSHLSHSPTVIIHAPPQPDLGNWQTTAGAFTYTQAFRANPSPSQGSDQGDVAPSPCVGCTKRMAKVRTNDEKSMAKTDACHYQSIQGTKACYACSKGGRKCVWIKDNLLKDVAMTVQMGFQRAKEERDGYSKEEKEQCRWALEELKRKYPSH